MLSHGRGTGQRLVVVGLIKMEATSVGVPEQWAGWVVEIPKCLQNMYTAGQERAVLSILLAMLLALLKRYRLGMAVGFHG